MNNMVKTEFEFEKSERALSRYFGDVLGRVGYQHHHALAHLVHLAQIAEIKRAEWRKSQEAA